MKRAVICGAGISGLSTAIGLAQGGWTVDIFERGSSIREIGAGIFIKGNGLKVLQGYGILSEIQSTAVRLREAKLFDSEGGLLQRRKLDDVNSVWNVKRQWLLRCMLDCATAHGVRVHTGAPVEEISPEGRITVSGTQVSADLVVAADGVNSNARRQLGLDVPIRRPRSGAIRLLVPRTEHEAEDGTREFWSGQMRVGVAPCTDTEVYSYLAAPLSDSRGARAPIDAEYWASHFPELKRQGFFDRADRAGGVHHPYPLVRTRAWQKGRVALVGDAVHALPPTLGQGAGLSLMNSHFLTKYLNDASEVPTALMAWERDWRWVSDRTQLWASRYDWITSEWPRSIYKIRRLALWAIGKSRRLNTYMRVADRVDAVEQRVLPAVDFKVK